MSEGTIRGRVLLAEDEPDIQRLIELILSKAGLEVDLADDGNAACEMALASQAEGRPYDLILMNMLMPELNGFEATRRLRQSGWKGPIIALTAYAMPDDCDKCLQAGCDDYISKPVDHEDLLAAVARHLG